MKRSTSSEILNFLLYAVGMFGVWICTHSLWALFWTTIAAVHIAWDAEKVETPTKKYLGILAVNQAIMVEDMQKRFPEWCVIAVPMKEPVVFFPIPTV